MYDIFRLQRLWQVGPPFRNELFRAVANDLFLVFALTVWTMCCAFNIEGFEVVD